MGMRVVQAKLLPSTEQTKPGHFQKEMDRMEETETLLLGCTKMVGGREEMDDKHRNGNRTN
jgi:hypothetical protein